MYVSPLPQFLTYTSFPPEICKGYCHILMNPLLVLTFHIFCSVESHYIGLTWIMVSNLTCSNSEMPVRNQPVGKEQFLARLVVTVPYVTFQTMLNNLNSMFGHPFKA